MSNLTPIRQSHLKDTIICIQRWNIPIKHIASRYFGLPKPKINVEYQGQFFELVFDMSQAGSAMTISDMFNFICEIKSETKNPDTICVYF